MSREATGDPSRIAPIEAVEIGPVQLVLDFPKSLHIHKFEYNRSGGTRPPTPKHKGPADARTSTRPGDPVSRNARLGLRLPSDLLPRSLKLAGKSLDLDGCKLRVGVSETRALVPAAILHCRIATTKNGDNPARFDAEIARQVAALRIQGKVFRVPKDAGRSDGRNPSRRIVRVKNKRIVGYSVLATELTDEESILLQERGLGGRRRMGWGFCAKHIFSVTTFKRLLAKSSQTPDTPREAETLSGHTANVIAAAQTLLDETADTQLSASRVTRFTGSENLGRFGAGGALSMQSQSPSMSRRYGVTWAANGPEKARRARR